jgi:hypothetical protein
MVLGSGVRPAMVDAPTPSFFVVIRSQYEFAWSSYVWC